MIMKEIRIIKTFYVWQSNGKIDDKWIIYCVKDNGEHTVSEVIINLESQVKKLVDDLKDEHPSAQVRFVNKQKDERTKYKYKVLSEDVKQKTIL